MKKNNKKTEVSLYHIKEALKDASLEGRKEATFPWYAQA